MGEPITPHATIPQQADIDAALRELDVSEPVILPVAEASCESPRLDTLQSLAGETPDE
jgi:hypothetical protein